MTTLVACLSTGKGTWGHLSQLIANADWEKVILITPFGSEKFTAEKPVEFIEIDEKKFLPELIEDIKKQLEKKLSLTDIEVALNLVSGSGKEHMAILSALLKLGLGIRLVALTKEGVREI